jgi:hypothetical protein
MSLVKRRERRIRGETLYQLGRFLGAVNNGVGLNAAEEL